MRITYRANDVKAYWAARWSDIPPDGAMVNAGVYPLKYALQAVDAKAGEILEAGCGAGRILRYFHQSGYDIIGIDYIDVAVQKLARIDPTLKVEVGDVTRLNFPDGRFMYVLAFGLYHNLETGLEDAVAETWRVLQPGGRLCASFRADNIQTRLTDWLANRKTRKTGKAAGTAFHKINLTRREFAALFEQAGFVIESISPVENMPILYKFSFFRAREHKTFNENKARAEGYRLSWLGRGMQAILMAAMPDQFCNIYVMIARRP